MFTLRKKQKSYSEIAKELKISKSTVSRWIAKDPDSIRIREYLIHKNIENGRVRIRRLIKSMNEKWANWRLKMRGEADREFKHFIDNQLFTAGIMLYWGEGDNNPQNPLRLSNTDPRMIGLYIRFLRQMLKVPENKIKIGFVLYPDFSEKTCRSFWSKITHGGASNFLKVQYIKG